MSATYFHDAAELPPGVPLLIYGAGGRGQTLAGAIQAAGANRLLGFVDSFKAGECMDLPVRRLDDLPVFLARPEAAGARIVVASTFHRKIAVALASIGIMDQFVCLDPTEEPPLVDVPTAEVPGVLARHRHPLCATRRPSRGGGRLEAGCLRCGSFSSVYFRPSGLTLCCWLPDLVELPEKAGPSDFLAALRRLDAIRHELAASLDRGENPFCASCPELCETPESALPTRFDGLHLDVSTKCNLNCSYCIVKNTFQGVEYDFDALLRTLRTSGMLAEGPYFDWGGAGEPTLYPGFGALTEELLAEGGHGLVYSNALRFSEVIEWGLRGRLSLTCSVDAGTSETYAAVRGVDGFERVWTNIARYVAAGASNVAVKYIVTADNASEGEIAAFVRRCQREGVRRVIISRDFYREDVPERERAALRSLAGQLSGAGIEYNFLGMAVPEGLG